jgi:hypothetical protein
VIHQSRNPMGTATWERVGVASLRLDDVADNGEWVYIY